MRTLVIGGAASGKSELAESLVVSGIGPRYYIATMMPHGSESQRRIKKHRLMREKKGFTTFECYTGLASLKLPARGTVLLECLGNLTANEMFAPEGAGSSAYESMLAGIKSLEEQCDDLVVVTNDVFADGGAYPQETKNYINVLGEINQAVAGRFDRLLEVVCGIPIPLKEVVK